MKSSDTYFRAIGWEGLRPAPVELMQRVRGCNAVGSCKQLLVRRIPGLEPRGRAAERPPRLLCNAAGLSRRHSRPRW